MNTEIKKQVKQVREILQQKGYVLADTYFKLDIYMVPKCINISSIKSLQELNALGEYILLKDDNSTKKTITYKKDVVKCENKVTGKIESISSTIKLLKILGYKEFININQTIYCYIKKDTKAETKKQIKVKDIKKMGIYIEYFDKDILDDIKDSLDIKKDIKLNTFESEEEFLDMFFKCKLL
ncbi:MAG: hypothetical protein RSE00_04770 [Clostridia bacterium]